MKRSTFLRMIPGATLVPNVPIEVTAAITPSAIAPVPAVTAAAVIPEALYRFLLRGLDLSTRYYSWEGGSGLGSEVRERYRAQQIKLNPQNATLADLNFIRWTSSSLNKSNCDSRTTLEEIITSTLDRKDGITAIPSEVFDDPKFLNTLSKEYDRWLQNSELTPDQIKTLPPEHQEFASFEGWLRLFKMTKEGQTAFFDRLIAIDKPFYAEVYNLIRPNLAKQLDETLQKALSNPDPHAALAELKAAGIKLSHYVSMSYILLTHPEARQLHHTGAVLYPAHPNNNPTLPWYKITHQPDDPISALVFSRLLEIFGQCSIADFSGRSQNGLMPPNHTLYAHANSPKIAIITESDCTAGTIIDEEKDYVSSLVATTQWQTVVNNQRIKLRHSARDKAPLL